MSFPAFCRGLFETGRVQVVPPDRPLSPADLAAADEIIQMQQAELRHDFPGQPPAWCVGAAQWAAVSFYRACQLAVYRDLDAAAIDELLGQACPAAEAASRHWSVDSVFRFLPDLVRHASTASPGDPLVARLRQWAAAWPLSSVGIADVTPQREDEIASHAGLLQCYVDRILTRKDWSRVAHPAVRAAADRSLGGHRSLFPEAAQRLAPTTTLETA